ncbi:MAG: hypothetical protein JRI92_06600 [Deltaproteobacteria bacterium]|nr:hypothetical protein [Deltaproteobacteria bacterium]
MSKESKKNQLNIIELKKERDRLRQKLTAIEADYRKGLAPDSEDKAIELENADVLEGIARATAEGLEKVEASLSELE